MTSDSGNKQTSETVNSLQSIGGRTSISANVNPQQGLRPSTSQIGRKEKRDTNQGSDKGANRISGLKPQGPKISENLLQINVFFQTLNVQTVAEEPKYPVRLLLFIKLDLNQF